MKAFDSELCGSWSRAIFIHSASTDVNDQVRCEGQVRSGQSQKRKDDNEAICSREMQTPTPKQWPEHELCKIVDRDSIKSSISIHIIFTPKEGGYDPFCFVHAANS